MKKKLIAIFFVAVAVTTVFGGDNSQNLIKNGNFEAVDEKGDLKKWKAYCWTKGGKASVKQVDGSVTGKKAALLESTIGKGNLLIVQTFNKPIGILKKYKITLKFKGAIDGTVHTSIKTFNTNNKDKNAKQYEYSAKIKGGERWKDLTAFYTVKPESNKVFIYLRSNKTPVIFEDVKVVEVTE